MPRDVGRAEYRYNRRPLLTLQLRNEGSNVCPVLALHGQERSGTTRDRDNSLPLFEPLANPSYGEGQPAPNRGRQIAAARRRRFLPA